MMKVLVLGHCGMLGHVAVHYFAEAGLDVLTVDSRYTGRPRDPLVEAARHSNADWVVNCAGTIKQKCNDRTELLRVNALLPMQLAARLTPHQSLLHVSTDCVFSGKKGGYRTNEESDAEDDYGFSKLLGEQVAQQERCHVFRVSMVGPEPGSGHGLLGWFLKQSAPVTGYTNHWWNGITTLEWCKQALALMRGELTPPQPVIQFASPGAVTKCELLRLFGQIWDHRIEIHARPAPAAINRTLVGDVICPPLEQQLRNMHDWHQRHFDTVLTEVGR
jgi:dTDP-4-dehydrorhamnose reductase